MAEEPKNMLRYRILRYTPNLIRDEWVNVGVLLEEAEGPRRAVRLIEDASEIARVRRLHPGADEGLLRALPSQFDARLRAAETDVRVYLGKLSDVLQLSPQRGLLADDFDMELKRLYREHVAPPLLVRGRILENTRAWIRARVNDVFRLHRVPKIARGVRVEEFTQLGDPFRLDYAYRYDGTAGYIHTLALGRDPQQAKVLAYTAGCIRARAATSVFTAITEVEPTHENTRHQFIARLLAERRIEVVPLKRIDKFAEDLRQRVQ
jgi:Protein of unknown function (DUF3037)